jgi:hypothetical protein
VGILTPDQHIDNKRMQLIRQASRPLTLTFHRAFDVINLTGSSPEQALQQVIDIGCDRLLTSGMNDKADSDAGIICLKQLSQYAHDVSPSFVVIAASGVNALKCGCIISETGVGGVHAGSSVTTRRIVSPLEPLLSPLPSSLPLLTTVPLPALPFSAQSHLLSPSPSHFDPPISLPLTAINTHSSSSSVSDFDQRLVVSVELVLELVTNSTSATIL